MSILIDFITTKLGWIIFGMVVGSALTYVVLR